MIALFDMKTNDKNLHCKIQDLVHINKLPKVKYLNNLLTCCK